jgi:hypothetical protein
VCGSACRCQQPGQLVEGFNSLKNLTAVTKGDPKTMQERKILSEKGCRWLLYIFGGNCPYGTSLTCAHRNDSLAPNFIWTYLHLQKQPFRVYF